MQDSTSSLANTARATASASMKNPGPGRGHTSRLLVLFFALLVPGCGPRAENPHPVWPAPPEAARVVHRATARRASDLAAPGVLDRLGRLVTGDSPVALLRPAGIAVDPGRRLYVADQEHQAVLAFGMSSPEVRRFDKAGDVHFVSPVAVAVCGGSLAVSDSALKTVAVLSLDGRFRRTIDKPGGFARPTGLAYDRRRDELYVVDTLANEICVFAFTSGQLVRRFGRQGVGPEELNYPTHICLDSLGRVYVTDSMNFRVQVLDEQGRYVRSIGRHGNASGHMGVPKGVGVDRHGHIYVVDSYFETVQVFDAQGRFLLAVGEGGEGAGQFRIPTALTVDEQDRLYVADSHNRRIQILQYVGGPSDE